LKDLEIARKSNTLIKPSFAFSNRNT